jgi:DNA polymerase-3 subunit delta
MPMATFKPAYLIHGDDHGRVGERRSSLRKVAEAAGDGGVETFEGDNGTPEAIAAALCAMTFATGRRFLIVDGVEKWKDADVTATLAAVLASPDPDTTVAFFGREEGRYKVPAALVKAVQKAGGDVVNEKARDAKALPGWVQEQGARLGIVLDREAASTFVAIVGERQQRLSRELEKLAIEHGTGGDVRVTLDAEQVEDAVANASVREVWGLGDALVAGDLPAATRQWLALRDRGEATFRLISLVVRRLREVHGIAVRLEAGESPAAIKASTRGNPWAVDKRIAEARRADAERLGRGIELLAELERDTRGGNELEDDTNALRALAGIAG